MHPQIDVMTLRPAVAFFPILWKISQVGERYNTTAYYPRKFSDFLKILKIGPE